MKNQNGANKTDNFAGDSKVGDSLLGRAEKKLVKFMAPKVPKRIETYHLTLMTIPWSLGAILFGYLCRFDSAWVFGISLMVVFQYITDVLDGAVGRQRNTGLVKWGFYMDHLLDFVFVLSLLTGYALLSPPGLQLYYALLFICSGGVMVSSFLMFASTNEFEIYHNGIGPTEIRIGHILLHLTIFYFGVDFLKTAIPIFFAANLGVFCLLAYKGQQRLWRMDMDAKA